jgi:hypothetical protein
MNNAPKKKVKYDLDEMKKAMEKCDKNIAIFENAIQGEIKTKNWYRHIIGELEMDLAGRVLEGDDGKD